MAPSEARNRLVMMAHCRWKRSLAMALAVPLASCGAQEVTCDPPPDAGQGGLLGCVHRVAYQYAVESGSELELVRTAVNQCSVLLDRDLNRAQTQIKFPNSLRDQYRDLIRKDVEQGALHRISEARAGSCKFLQA